MELHKEKEVKSATKNQFLIRNLLKGFFWLAVIVAAFIIAKNNIDINYISWLKPIYENPSLVFLVFMISEFVFGIIPPEIFFMWALTAESIYAYAQTIALLACISYAAGIFGFWFGTKLNRTTYFRLLKRKYLSKYEKYINKFGAFLIIVSSLTPIPFSAISMLVGSLKYPFRQYLIYSLFRFARFAAYAAIIYEANKLS